MNISGLFSIISIKQESVYQDFEQAKKVVDYCNVDFVEYIKSNVVMTTCIPPEYFNTQNYKLKMSDNTILCNAYALLSEGIVTENFSTPELIALAGLFTRQCVLCTTAIYSRNLNNNKFFEEDVIQNTVCMLPAFPIVLSEKCNKVHLDFINKDVPQWYYQDDNSLLNDVIEYLKSNKDEINHLIYSLITEYPSSIRNINYEYWTETFNHISNCVIKNKYGHTAEDILYYQIAMLYLAKHNVFCEFNWRNIL